MKTLIVILSLFGLPRHNPIPHPPAQHRGDSSAPHAPDAPYRIRVLCLYGSVPAKGYWNIEPFYGPRNMINSAAKLHGGHVGIEYSPDKVLSFQPRTYGGLVIPVTAAQQSDTARIARIDRDSIVLAPLIYLASDYLEGRCIGSPGIDTAAKYIAAQFRKAGARPVPGATSYFQTFKKTISAYNFSRVGIGVGYNIPLNAAINGFVLKNIVAYVPGNDPILRREYIMLSAHYDHIGVADTPILAEGKEDSIFNGARDNATGTAAVIAAARYFGKHPAKRSILFVCFTAEEEGEIGSAYYTGHPLVPLAQTVFDLNVDNAGYNTTHAICLFGLGRTNADTMIKKACMEYGLAVFAEPPGLELFERSDNFNLAQIGVPSPCFSLGMTAWDAKIDRYYHKVGDEVGNMDLNYIVRFIRAYILSAQYIADDPVQPRWTPGDPFENAWLSLYASPSHPNASPQHAVLPSPAHP
jgi:Peptidase family M28